VCHEVESRKGCDKLQADKVSTSLIPGCASPPFSAASLRLIPLPSGALSLPFTRHRDRGKRKTREKRTCRVRVRPVSGIQARRRLQVAGCHHMAEYMDHGSARGDFKNALIHNTLCATLLFGLLRSDGEMWSTGNPGALRGRGWMMTCRWLLDAASRGLRPRPTFRNVRSHITCITWYSLVPTFIHRPIESHIPSLRVKHPANLNPERDARIHDASKRLELELVPQDRVCPVRYGRPTQ
jgi:hypothetical protein